MKTLIIMYYSTEMNDLSMPKKYIIHDSAVRSFDICSIVCVCIKRILIYI